MNAADLFRRAQVMTDTAQIRSLPDWLRVELAGAAEALEVAAGFARDARRWRHVRDSLDPDGLRLIHGRALRHPTPRVADMLADAEMRELEAVA